MGCFFFFQTSEYFSRQETWHSSNECRRLGRCGASVKTNAVWSANVWKTRRWRPIANKNDCRNLLLSHTVRVTLLLWAQNSDSNVVIIELFRFCFIFVNVPCEWRCDQLNAGGLPVWVCVALRGGGRKVTKLHWHKGRSVAGIRRLDISSHIWDRLMYCICFSAETRTGFSQFHTRVPTCVSLP